MRRRSKNPLIRILAEPNEQDRSLSQSRRPQVAGRPEHVAQEGLMVRGIALHREGDDLAALADDDRGNVPRQTERVGPPELRFGVDRFLRGDVMIRKEPLRALARGSSVAVVVPIDGSGHGVRYASGKRPLAPLDLKNSQILVERCS